MDIRPITVTIEDLVDGYCDSGDDGVVGYGERLDIRPPYQREFVYKEKDRDAVIDSVLRGYPLNSMYWMERDDGNFEVLDGQQRTLSICHFVHEPISVKFEGNTYGFDTLPDDIRAKMLSYKLNVYICNGTPSERQNWFETINIAGKELSPQEIRNAVYHSDWVSDAKRHFVGEQANKKYLKKLDMYLSKKNDGRIRHYWLETAIKWHKSPDESIEEYMTERKIKKDKNAKAMWTHLKAVIEWVEMTFPTYRKEMNGLDWGRLYRKHSPRKFDIHDLDRKIAQLMENEEIEKKKGVWEFVLTNDKRHLTIRAFREDLKATAYEKQNGVCPGCGEHKEREEMHADHKDPFAKGGLTTLENLQMLCATCNLKKGKG